MALIFISLGIFIGYLDWKGSKALTDAANLIKQEMWGGSTPFYKWLGALIIVWAIGLIPDMRGVSTMMLILILLSMALSHSSGVLTIEKAL